MGFTAHPISTFFGNGALGQFVFKLDFKVGAIKTTLPFGFRDMKFAPLLVEFISDFVGNKGGRGKNKVQLINMLQFFFKCLKRINRKTRGGNFKLCRGLEGLLETVAKQVVDVINEFHAFSLAERYVNEH